MPENDAPAPNPDRQTGSRLQTFARRLLSTVLVWGIIVAAFVVASPWLFFALLVLLGLVGLAEYFQLFPERGFRRFQWLALVIGFLYFFAVFSPALDLECPWLTEPDGVAIAALLILVVLFRLRSPLEGRQTLYEIAATIFGFAYVILLFGFLAKILVMPLTDGDGDSSSHFYILFLLAVTKFTDMGAYAIGSLIGRHKMVPHVSPGKTWQGFGGAIFAACVAGFLCLWIFGEKIPLITPFHTVVLAVTLALVAVLGDLAESSLKRSLDAKDSGRIMPGIGGVLDLIDSILFTAPIFYFYLRALLL